MVQSHNGTYTRMIVQYATTWMNLTNMMLSKRNQIPTKQNKNKDPPFIKIPFICNSKQSKLICNVRSQDGGYPWGGLVSDRKGVQGGLLEYW